MRRGTVHAPSSDQICKQSHGGLFVKQAAGALTELVRGDLAGRRHSGERHSLPFLRRQLARERARNAGLEIGISALNRRVADLAAENAQLRAQLSAA